MTGHQEQSPFVPQGKQGGRDDEGIWAVAIGWEVGLTSQKRRQGAARQGIRGVCRGVLTDTHGLLCGAGAVSSLGGAGICDWKGNDNDDRSGP
jgi:hypothetical protein